MNSNGKSMYWQEDKEANLAVPSQNEASSCLASNTVVGTITPYFMLPFRCALDFTFDISLSRFLRVWETHHLNAGSLLILLANAEEKMKRSKVSKTLWLIADLPKHGSQSRVIYASFKIQLMVALLKHGSRTYWNLIQGSKIQVNLCKFWKKKET